jgi:hypothetical protein
LGKGQSLWKIFWCGLFLFFIVLFLDALQVQQIYHVKMQASVQGFEWLVVVCRSSQAFYFGSHGFFLLLNEELKKRVKKKSKEKVKIVLPFFVCFVFVFFEYKDTLHVVFHTQPISFAPTTGQTSRLADESGKRRQRISFLCHFLIYGSNRGIN